MQTNRVCKTIWQIHFKCVIVIMVLGVSMGPISVIFCQNSGNYDVKCFVHSSRVMWVKFIWKSTFMFMNSKSLIHRLPWNQQTLTGYTAELCFVALFIGIYFISNGSFIILFISICLHHQTYYKIFQQSTLEFSHFNGNHKELLCKLVHFHISIRKWIQFYLVNSWIYFFYSTFLW